MRFSKLRLNGFKSFVDPTDLIITDGLTGVVGPNGCGKSNLLEALRWVMGENRPTAMRGGGMEDVIFAGAATRPARHFAEVSIHIDNSDRLAPAGFNDSDLLEITRRITRDAGSAYKANTKDVRARDIQMLFADASTGAHSPALVRQGQIVELINAKPKARRRILEEAAGISGLYQRRHEAELKLKGAETNLLRVEDVIEQLAGQLAQLARQARQAARYRTIGEDLRTSEGLLLYRRWKEADTVRATSEEALKEAVVIAGKAERHALQMVAAREKADGELPALREEEAIAAAVLQRLQVERDTLRDQENRALQAIDTLTARIEQLDQDHAREESLQADAGETIERLEWEQAEIRKAGEGYEKDLSEAADVARDAARLLQERESALAELTEDVARLAARHQSAQRLLDDCKTTLEKSEAGVEQAGREAEEADSKRIQSETEFTEAEAALKIATNAAESAESALISADEAREEIQAREADARAQHSAAEGEANALRAEVSALNKLVDRDAVEKGQVLDAVGVDAGYEQALGAALADDLRAPQINASGASGWAELAAYGDTQPLPDGVIALSEYMKVPAVLSRRMSQVGLVDRADGPGLQEQLRPGQRLVSKEGDLWRWDGFRAGAEDTPTAAALRLQQLNRLVELKRTLEEVSARAMGASQAHEVLRTQLRDATEADKAAREARRKADHSVAEASRALSKAEAEHNLATGRLESLKLAVRRHQDEAVAAREAVADAEKGFADLADLDTVRAEAEDVKTGVETARATMLEKRSAHEDLRREGEARTRRAQEITQEISGWKHRQSTAGKQLIELLRRQSEAKTQLEDATAMPEQIAAKRESMAGEIDTAETRRREAADALALAETNAREALEAERKSERDASDARAALAATEARADAARETVEIAAQRIEEEQGCDADQLLARLDTNPEEMPEAEALEARVNQLKRQRDALGAVNLRAEEDAKEIEGEHGELLTEKTDLEEAIKALRTGIANLNKEGRERLLTAFEQVNSNFSMLFKHLFGGGEAKLVLVESDDPLEAGLEIMCQPPGKKLSTLSLLSGGEQTLTALALIFAVFLANPAPICVLDEVDAPLDDANVTRFCDLLDEMCQRTDTRFLIITHHAVTMARMDRLFGVTMGEQGVSQLVSVDLKKAEAMVA